MLDGDAAGDCKGVVLRAANQNENDCLWQSYIYKGDLLVAPLYSVSFGTFLAESRKVHKTFSVR